MPQDHEKIDPKGAPSPAASTDTSPGSRTHPLHHKTHQERLAYWDEWNDRDRERMAQDPHAGPALQHLQRVEAWLHDSLLTAQGCPEPEALFALAGPQAAEELQEEEREELRAHIAICPTCEAEVASLATPPPSPLLLTESGWSMPEFLQEKWAPPADTLEDASQSASPTATRAPHASSQEWSPQERNTEEQSPEEQDPTEQNLTEQNPTEQGAVDPRPAPILAGPTPWRHLAMAAAAIVLVWFLAARESSTVDASSPWPEVPTLRSTTTAPSSHPSGPVLARSELGHWSGRLQAPTVDGASAYILRLYAHDGSAFDQGEKVGQWTQTEPLWTPPAPLPAGFYTAEFAALLNGLEVALPASEFEVRASPTTWQHLQTLEGVDRVRYLFANGWNADARQEAQQLPASESRRRFLKAVD